MVLAVRLEREDVASERFYRHKGQGVGIGGRIADVADVLNCLVEVSQLAVPLRYDLRCILQAVHDEVHGRVLLLVTDFVCLAEHELLGQELPEGCFLRLVLIVRIVGVVALRTTEGLSKDRVVANVVGLGLHDLVTLDLMKLALHDIIPVELLPLLELLVEDDLVSEMQS